MVRRGKTQRRRRQRGGINPLKTAVLAALSALSLQQPSSALSWSELSKPMSKERIDEVAGNVVKWISENRPVGVVEASLPKVTSTLEDMKTWLEPTPAVPSSGLTASQMKNRATYTWNGQTFEVNTWEPKGNDILVSTSTGQRLTIPMKDPVTLVSGPDEDYVNEGGRRRRRSRRKTLRRKK